MIIYREANSSDISQIVDIFFASFSDLIRRRYGGLPSRAAIRDVIVLYIDAAQGGFIVAEENGKLLGFIIAVKNLRTPWSTLLTKHILKLPLFLFSPRIFFISPSLQWHFFIGAHIVTEAIVPEAIGKGIGTKLGEIALEHLKKKGVKRVYFETESNNESIKRIYLKLGFKVGRQFRTRTIRWLTMFKDF